MWTRQVREGRAGLERRGARGGDPGRLDPHRLVAGRLHRPTDCRVPDADDEKEAAP